MVKEVGSIGAVKIRLAREVAEQDAYQRRYIPVDPQGVAGATQERPVLPFDDQVRVWAMRSWKGGEGESVWKDGANKYREGSVRPVRIGDGIEPPAPAEETVDSGGTNEFADAGRFGIAEGKLWVGRHDDIYSWDDANSRWSAARDTGGTALLTSIADGDDGWIYTAHADETVWRNNGSTEENHVTSASSTFSNDPVLCSWGGLLFALDGDDLYEIDKTSANTVTQRADIAGSSAEYRSVTPDAYNRICAGEDGPVWLQRLDNGQTWIWTYEVAADTQRRLGRLPLDFVWPYSVAVHYGFVFVGFRVANDDGGAGDAYLYFQRGAQKGVLGPLRDGATSPVLIAGMVGDDLMLHHNARLWAYNLTDGALYEAAVSGGDGTAVTVFGKDVFIGDISVDGGNVLTGAIRVPTDKYNDFTNQTISIAYIDTGTHDFGYPSLEKILTEIQIVTDPLPATASVQVEVSVDGGSRTTLSDTHSTTDATSSTLKASTSASAFIGKVFELRVSMFSTSDSDPPRIREIYARATGASHLVEWVLLVDCSDIDSQTSAKLIDSLNGLADSSTVVSLEDPWQNPDHEDPDTFDVTVEEVVTPPRRDKDSDAEPVATVRLRGVNLV